MLDYIPVEDVAPNSRYAVDDKADYLPENKGLGVRLSQHNFILSNGHPIVRGEL